MKYDSPEWRESRNVKLREWIGDEYALQFILTIGHVAEIWDDMIDKDRIITDQEINDAFRQILVSLPMNPFFDRYKSALIPIMNVGINTWIDSNELEKRGTYNDFVQAYVLRDWYVELISSVIEITRGYNYMRSVSLAIRDFFSAHESFEDYRSSKK